jgi:FkbM family methyltransferase
MMMSATAIGKKWVRPLLVPAFRFYIRYVPVALGKPTLWNVVSNMLQFADHRFNARTVFNMNFSGNTVDQIQRRIYYFGLWEPNLTAFLERRLSPGDLFVDVGANIGYFSLLAAKLVGPTGKVLAIEASPIIFEKLANNIKQNKLNNIVAHNLAVSDSNGIARVYMAPEGNIGETTILETKGHTFESEIPCRRLDEILSSEDLQRTKVIKIDVEGAEWSVISGMPQVLDSCPESLEFVIEISPKRLAALGKSAGEILQVFEMAGFNAYELVNDYSDAAYLPPQSEKRPTRLTRSIEERPVIDLVFSKRNLDTI